MSHVRPATREDVDAMVDIHRRAFPDFMLTLLGGRFLQHLYSHYVLADEGVAFVAAAPESGCAIDGFITGACDPEVFFRSMRHRRGVRMALAAIPALMLHPLAVGERLLAAISFRGDKPPDLGRAALISSLAVSPSAQRGGTGKSLVRAFCSHVAQFGHVRSYLTTDMDDNEIVLRFYAGCGFAVHSVLRRPNGRRMSLLVKEIDHVGPG